MKTRFREISRCFMLIIKKFSDHCQFMELDRMTTIMLPHGPWLFDNVREDGKLRTFPEHPDCETPASCCIIHVDEV